MKALFCDKPQILMRCTVECRVTLCVLIYHQKAANSFPPETVRKNLKIAKFEWCETQSSGEFHFFATDVSFSRETIVLFCYNNNFMRLLIFTYQ